MPKSGTAVATPIGLNGDPGIPISDESKSTDLMLSSARSISSMDLGIWLRLSMERHSSRAGVRFLTQTFGVSCSRSLCPGSITHRELTGNGFPHAAPSWRFTMVT